MRCIVLITLLSFSLFSRAQKYAVNTIFELLKIENQSCEINSSKKLWEEATVAAPYEENPENRQTFSVDDLASYEAMIAAHFKRGYSKAVPFTQLYRFNNDGKLTRLMRRANEYKLIDDKGKVLLYDGFYTVYQDGSDGRGFNAYKKGRKSYYYNSDGKLIFDRKFDYVKNEYDGLYVVANDGKYGVTDTAGNLLLATKYTNVVPVKTNHTIYFSVNDGNDQYFIEYGKNEKLLINSYQSLPLVIKDRYWLLLGELYDMQNKKRLFCNMQEYIEIFDRERGLFYIRDSKTNMLTVFDIQGKLAFGEKITRVSYINSNLSVCGVLAEDGAEKKDIYRSTIKYGIVNNRNSSWQVSPSFLNMSVLDSNFIKYVSNRQVGLMDADGNVIFKEGMFNDFQATKVPYSVLCIGDSTSSLYNFKTKTFIKSNVLITSIEKMAGDLFIARYKSGKEWYTGFADKELNIVQLPKFKSVYFDNEIKLFVCNLANNKAVNSSDELKIFYDSSLKQQKQTVNGKLHDSFRNIQFLSSFATLYSIGLNDDYVRINNRFIKTPYRVYKCDSLSNYFIVYKDGRYGIIDFDGKEILPPRFSYISENYHTGKIVLTVNDKTVVIGMDGKVLFDNKYEKIQPLLNEYYIVTRNNKTGIVNSKEEEVLKVVYDYAYTQMGGVVYGDNYNKHFISVADLAKTLQKEKSLKETLNKNSKKENIRNNLEVAATEAYLGSMPAPETDENDRIFTKVETEARFPGGNVMWEKFCQQSMSGFNAADNGAPPGRYTVIVRFIVSRDGSISDVRAETKFGYGMEEKAVKIIKNGPQWLPAVVGERNVHSYHRQTILFTVEDQTKSVDREQLKKN